MHGVGAWLGKPLGCFMQMSLLHFNHGRHLSATPPPVLTPELCYSFKDRSVTADTVPLILGHSRTPV